MCDFSRTQLKSHVIAPCAAAFHATLNACNKNRTDQTSLILSHAIACICTLSQRCAALVQCDNCHNQSQTCHKSHDKWNMAASWICVDAILNKIAGYRRVCGMERRKQNLMRSCNCDEIAKVCGGLNRPYLQPVAELRRTQINVIKSKGILKAPSPAPIRQL